jgi:hypothetical protein
LGVARYTKYPNLPVLIVQTSNDLLGWTAPSGIEVGVFEDVRQGRPSVEQIVRIGMDTSKHIFRLHGVKATEKPVVRKKLRRKELEAFFAKLPPTVIGIEARGGSVDTRNGREWM